MGTLADRVVVITGGGGAIARGVIAALAREGAGIAVLERDPERGEESAKRARELGATAIALTCDISQRDQIDAAVAEIVEGLGRIDVLINNATGVNAASTNLSFMDHDEATLDRILSVDVKGTFHCMQACFPYLRDSGNGRVINFSSAAGSERLAGFTAYAAAKEGVRALTGVAAREWGEFGITVNVICPSVMTDGIRQYLADNPDPKLRELMLATKPIARFGDAEQDIGRVVVFLASADASYLTGQTLWVDGGGTIHA